ncbi:MULTISPECIES: YbeD family protein [Moraxella]|uniref:DUF493 domain-containing protein n=1 Tax=Moraxella nasicaprae TaxID=2904122 RepID=A0ABY6F3F8_9GAMM|nr:MULTISPECIES: DUF493 domain-containing protein [Moraxella]MDO4895447.1 DUF493 domain-containing protein [Moraxella sp.]UXZ04617.1 DUF493 domain-containing protein [Moraxella nasicaprae]
MNSPIRTDIQNPDLWQFPMDYPMSIIGNEGEKETLLSEVTLILAELFPEFDAASIQMRASRTNRFYALKLTLHLRCAEEVNRLYAALAAAKTVRTVV